jgi:hypothetical protein
LFGKNDGPLTHLGSSRTAATARFVTPALLNQHVGQQSGSRVAAADPGAQPVQVAALFEQIGQPRRPTRGGVAVQRDGAAVQPPLAGAVSEPGGVVGWRRLTASAEVRAARADRLPVSYLQVVRTLRMNVH